MQFGLKRPVVIRYPRGGEGSIHFDIHESLEKNTAEIIKTGEDISIIAIGKMVDRAVEVANILEKQEKSVEVINVRFLKPLDEATLLKSIRKTKNVITIEDNMLKGGLGSQVEELIIKYKLVDISFKKYGYPDEFVKHGSLSEIEHKYGLNVETITKEVVENTKCILEKNAN